MRPLADVSPSEFRDIEVVLTDMDDTLTLDGRLAADTYNALERLEAAGVRVIPVTAAPAGWCDQMARMWPVTAVIGENGGFCLSRKGNGLKRRFWLAPRELETATARLRDIGRAILESQPSLKLSDDQPFRLTSLAIERPHDNSAAQSVLNSLRNAGADATLNSIWALAWFGGYDKLKAARKYLPAVTGHDIDLDRDRLAFVGDSANDASMFAHLPKSAGVSTVTHHLADIAQPPAWITKGPGGSGFVEVADAILSARRTRAPKAAVLVRESG
jgi:hypothetical protein